MATLVQLGRLEGSDVKPRFYAVAGDREFLIELDSSALLKLAGGRSYGDWLGLVEAQRGRIRCAAQELYDNGFLTPDEMPRIYVTALDLD